MFFTDLTAKKPHLEETTSTVSLLWTREPEFDHLVAMELRHRDFGPSLHRFKGEFPDSRNAGHARDHFFEFEGDPHIATLVGACGRDRDGFPQSRRTA